VCGRTVDLGRILGREAAAADRRVSAVGVDDDLSAGGSGIAPAAAEDEGAGRIDQNLGLLVEQLRINDRLDDLVDDQLAQLLLGDVLGVLGGDDDRIHAGDDAVVILGGDLRLAVRSQALVLSADLFQLLGQHMRAVDGEGHEALGLVAGIAEHDALVAGRQFLVVDGVVDLRGLLVDLDRDVVLLRVADVLEDLLGDALIVDLRLGSGFAVDQDQVVLDGRFHSHVALRILADGLVQDGVCDQVADFVRMSARDGLGCKECSCHKKISLLVLSFSNET